MFQAWAWLQTSESDVGCSNNNDWGLPDMCVLLSFKREEENCPEINRFNRCTLVSWMWQPDCLQRGNKLMQFDLKISRSCRILVTWLRSLMDSVAGGASGLRVCLCTIRSRRDGETTLCRHAISAWHSLHAQGCPFCSHMLSIVTESPWYHFTSFCCILYLHARRSLGQATQLHQPLQTPLTWSQNVTKRWTVGSVADGTNSHSLKLQA